MGDLIAYISANQALGIAAYVAGLKLVWLAGFLATAWLYGWWEARRRDREQAACCRSLVAAIRRGAPPPEP